MSDGNFAGVSGGSITVFGGNAGNTISAAGDTAKSTGKTLIYAAGAGTDTFAGGFENDLVFGGAGPDSFTGGAGNDVFYAGGNTTMKGGSGTNEFAFSAAGNNTIADFAASPTNEIAFSNSGFALGLSGATSTPQPLPPGLFVSDSTGTFTAPTQRFAYGTSNGELFYSASGSTATEHVVATLTGDPALTASQLFFIT